VWPDQVERFRQLRRLSMRRAVYLPTSHPIWVETALADGVPDVATVVYHSIVWKYLSNVDGALRAGDGCGRRGAATHNKTLAWLRFEPAGDVAEVRLQLWPGSKDRLLARYGFQGKPVQCSDSRTRDSK
jgi:hypothetical protein